MKFCCIFFIICVVALSYEITPQEDLIPVCSNKGILKESTKECQCVSGYTTYPKESKIHCNYQLKSSQIARLISLFGGFLGADMFYLGYNMKGLFKCFVPLGLFFLILKMQNNKSFQNFNFSYYFIFAPFLLSFLMWLIDLLMITSGVLSDSNGFNLN